MDKIYAVLRDTDGAHESCGVMSVWSTKEKADIEKERLNNLFGYEDEVKEWDLDISSGSIINW